jgi:hypothetical protein
VRKGAILSKICTIKKDILCLMIDQVIFDVPIKDYESTIKDKIPKNKKVTEIEI